MSQLGNVQTRSQTQANAQVQPEQLFDQWAKAVRQQMIEALKRRGNA